MFPLYLVTEQTCYHEDLGYYRTFGIQHWEYRENRAVLVSEIPDVSTDPLFVSLLAALCTRLCLDPGQLQEVVEDAIS